MAPELYSDEMEARDVCVETKAVLRYGKDEALSMGLCVTCRNLQVCNFPCKGKGVLFCEEFA
jgi:hypothetical protein